MPSKSKAKVTKIRNGLAVFIPAAWCRGSGIGRGTVVELVYNGVLAVKPPRPEGTAPQAPASAEDAREIQGCRVAVC